MRLIDKDRLLKGSNHYWLEMENFGDIESIDVRFVEMAEEHKGVIMNLQETLFEEDEFICDNEKKEENPILAAIKKMNQ